LYAAPRSKANAFACVASQSPDHRSVSNNRFLKPLSAAHVVGCSCQPERKLNASIRPASGQPTRMQTFGANTPIQGMNEMLIVIFATAMVLATLIATAISLMAEADHSESITHERRNPFFNIRS
jgi:hypothetical protein